MLKGDEDLFWFIYGYGVREYSHDISRGSIIIDHGEVSSQQREKNLLLESMIAEKVGVMAVVISSSTSSEDFALSD